VLQPLLLRWYFIILYIIISIFIGYMFIRNFKIREKRKYELFLAKKEKKQIRELSEMKMNFFMNLSHEFRTPLTLIISPLQKLLSTPNITKDELHRHLMNIQHNSSILLRLINQILKVSKQDKGKLDIELRESDIVDFCRNSFSQFLQLAHDKQIQFAFNTNVPHLLLLFDIYKMEEILYNLLSNAIKHT
ncbi:MAG TPA: HAMP domain-containing histidine kinase, partial [Bacteroides reticulotermitis]|nr:HAMP domain-containing histidine kinase [Bacteroides reticulotermitis]